MKNHKEYKKEEINFKKDIPIIKKYWKILTGVIGVLISIGSAVVFIINQTSNYTIWKVNTENQINKKIGEAEARLLVQIMQTEPEKRYQDLLQRVIRLENVYFKNNKGE